MKRLFTIIFLFATVSLSAQTVGLVLSGGGAKGIYHIGIIKALEENRIPIDYVSGSSIGAIIGGLYSIGYSPEDMEELFKSDAVKSWLSGKIEDRHVYYFKRMRANPSMLTLRFTKKDGKVIPKLPTNLIPPYQMDLGFLEILSPATAKVHGNFDSLFIPFRCMASDVYNKKQVVFRDGDLGSAIRMSMTFPFVFKPLTMDSVLMYDGGVYNNFPWQVLVEDFDPDILIGGKCVKGVRKPKDGNVMDQIETMMTMQTDFDLPEENGFLIERSFEDVSLLDFTQVDYLVNQGYVDAMIQMPQIKEKIKRRISKEELNAKREHFKSELPVLEFDRINIKGLNNHQENYVKRVLNLDKKHNFTIEDFKSEYFKLLSDEEITGDFPIATYDDSTEKFTLNMNMKTEPNVKLRIGGNISSSVFNQAFVGAEYRRIEETDQVHEFDGFFGTFYNSFRIGSRFDFYNDFPFFISGHYLYNDYNYLKSNYDLIFSDCDFPYTRNTDHAFVLTHGIPISRSTVVSLSGSIGTSGFRYYQTSDFSSKDRPDKTIFDYVSADILLERNSLNYPAFAKRGIHQKLSARYVRGTEKLKQGTTSTPSLLNSRGDTRYWWEFNFYRKAYITASKWLSLGYLLDVTYSNHPEFDNYYATNVTMTAFTPTTHSKTIYMKEYRSNSFIGAGIIPTISFTPSFYWQTGAYCFLPEFEKKETYETKRYKYIFSSSLVYQTFLGPVALTVAKYDTSQRDWYTVFNIGILLFNRGGIK